MEDIEPTQIVTPTGVVYDQPTGLFINNVFVRSSQSDSKIETYDPATEKLIVAVESATTDDVDKAVCAASVALKNPKWKLMEPAQRSRLLIRLADLIEDHKDLLATIDSWDNGKPLSESLTNDLPEAISVLNFYSSTPATQTGQTIPTNPNKLAYTLRQPIGVCAQIIPWNYPLSMAIWKLAPALATGNTVVLKPSELTPLSALLLADLTRTAGFPPGVINILNGPGPTTGSTLLHHPLVSKIAFTGSTATAKKVTAIAASTGLKNMTLETGGKSPLLVFPDADMEQAVRWAHLGSMSNQGQICTATSRILVHKDVLDTFVERFLHRTRTTSVVGDQWHDSTYQGPLVSRKQLEHVYRCIMAGMNQATTKLLLGGLETPQLALSQPRRGNAKGTGFFVSPTIFLTGPKPQETCPTLWKEEIFGPVATITPFATEAEALGLANDSRYGLGAAVFTTDLERAHRVAAEVEAGMVWINSSQDCDAAVPFGGVKQSGIGRELGEAGLEGYTQVKAVHVNLGNRL